MVIARAISEEEEEEEAALFCQIPLEPMIQEEAEAAFRLDQEGLLLAMVLPREPVFTLAALLFQVSSKIQVQELLQFHRQ